MYSAERQDSLGPELLQLARSSIEYGLIHRQPLPVEDGELSSELAAPAATFTTLRIQRDLRGCCGTLEAERPLAADVAYSAFRAAFHDPRFPPVRKAELDAVTLEVSVLSPLESLPVANEADLINQLRPGTDGLVILAGARRATFLPTVWESLPEPGKFLDALKVKCGLPGDYWSEQLAFQRYRTTSYAEAQ